LVVAEIHCNNYVEKISKFKKCYEELKEKEELKDKKELEEKK